jgi:thymidylate synthase
MNKFEQDYKALLIEVFQNGIRTTNRTNVDTLKLFNKSFNIDLREGFPIVTGKKIFFDKAYYEYIWIREGMTTTSYLNDKNINWWNQYARPNGDLGRVYGYQLRNYNGSFDQLAYVIKEIKQGSRRAVISMWNPTDLDFQALPNCYTNINFVRINDILNMNITFRSSDMFLGLPYDIIFGALLLIDVAEFTELKVGELGVNISDAHIYVNHKEQVIEYLQSKIFELPKFNNKFKEPTNKIKDYKHGKYIKAKLNN